MDSFAADGIYIDAPPERVFASLVDSREAEVWLEAERVELETFPGGRFTAVRPDGSTLRGALRLLEPGRRLVIEDCFLERREETRGPMTLVFILDRHPPGTWITVRQEGLDTGPAWKAFALRTREELVRLTVALKRHIEQI